MLMRLASDTDPRNSPLPPAVRNHLPEHAQDIYRAAFNHAFSTHEDAPVGVLKITAAKKPEAVKSEKKIETKKL